MHKNLEDFEFQPDPTTDYRVTYKKASEESMYNVVNNLAPSFLIGSSSFLQVTRTTIKSWMSRNSARSDRGLRIWLQLSV